MSKLPAAPREKPAFLWSFCVIASNTDIFIIYIYIKKTDIFMKVVSFQMYLACMMCLVLVSNTRFVQGSLTSCIHGGTAYKDGDYFPPNKTFIKTEGPFQCVQCRCNRGLVVCEIENCTFLECENPVKYPQYCCLRCPGTSKFHVASSDFLFGVETGQLPMKNSPADCVSNGQNYADGSEWQPIIGPLGAMACVRCQCREGNVVCTRLRCDSQPCSHPKREFGECCPVCPNPEKGNKSNALCLPKSSEILLYRTPNVENDTEEIEFAFWENSPQNKAVTVYIWNLRSKTSAGTLKVKFSSRDELPNRNLILIGSITHKRFKKFTQRGEKLQSKCMVQCLKKLKRLENSLGIRAVSHRGKCLLDEMDVSEL